MSQEEADKAADDPHLVADATVLTHPFSSGDALLEITRSTGLSGTRSSPVGRHLRRAMKRRSAWSRITAPLVPRLISATPRWRNSLR